MNSLIFTLALASSLITVMALVSSYIDGQKRNALANVIVTSILWGFYHWLSH